MSAPKLLLSFALTLCMAVPALAAEPRVLNWSDLQVAAPRMENPFDTMPNSQLADLRVHLQWRLATADERENEDFKTRADAALERLNAAGIDVEDLLDQRQRIMEARIAAANATNPDVLGQTVRIPGYVLPLEFLGKKVTEFLLVPTVGACIHTPAPPPNQVVHVSYPEGIEVAGLFAAVWVEGTLRSDNRVQDIGYSDGIAPVTSSYVLPATSVVDYE